LELNAGRGVLSRPVFSLIEVYPAEQSSAGYNQISYGCLAKKTGTSLDVPVCTWQFVRV
jgi:hypothetical protein